MQTKIHLKLGTLALPLLASACVSARATMLVPTGELTPVPAEQVRIFLKEEDVPESCQEIALIDAEGDASATNRTQLVEAARRRAGSIGANGLLLGELEEPTTGRAVASAILGISAERRSRLIAYHCESFDEDGTSPDSGA